MAGPRQAVRRSLKLAWLVTGPLAFLALLITGILLVKDPEPVGEWPLGLLFFALLAVAGATQLLLEVRRQTFTVSLVEVPVLIGLYFLPPVTLIIARVLAALVVFGRRKVPPTKLAFNAANVAAEAALACAVVFLAGPLDASEPITWFVLATAV